MWLLRSVIAETTVISSIMIPFYSVHAFELEQCFHFCQARETIIPLVSFFGYPNWQSVILSLNELGRLLFTLLLLLYKYETQSDSLWTLIIWSNDRVIQDLFRTSIFSYFKSFTLLVVREMIRAYLGTRHLTYGSQLELNRHQKLTKNAKAQPSP